MTPRKYYYFIYLVKGQNFLYLIMKLELIVIRSIMHFNISFVFLYMDFVDYLISGKFYMILPTLL